MKLADPLADVRAFAPEKYENIDLDRLTTYGIKVLIDRKIPTTFESIVVALYRMFPSKFSLLGHPEYPDAARVNRALLHCLPKYRNYVAGGARRGYFLTNQGLGAAEETGRLLGGERQSEGVRRKRASIPRAVADQFMREVSEAAAFRRFGAGELDQIDEYDLFRLLHAGPTTTSIELRHRLGLLETYAEQTARNDVHKFLIWLRSRFLADDRAKA